MSEIKPAMTAEEWEFGCYESEDISVFRKSPALDGSPRLDVTVRAHPIGSGVMGEPRDLHALAALSLENQPFGFRREDVERLRESATYVEAYDSLAGYAALAEQLLDLADRIEALLPPGVA